MTETIVRCDVCGGKPTLPVHYDYARYTDAAGSMDTEYKTIDLCITHMKDELQRLLVEPPGAPAHCGKAQFSSWAAQQKWKPVA